MLFLLAMLAAGLAGLALLFLGVAYLAFILGRALDQNEGVTFWTWLSRSGTAGG